MRLPASALKPGIALHFQPENLNSAKVDRGCKEKRAPLFWFFDELLRINLLKNEKTMTMTKLLPALILLLLFSGAASVSAHPHVFIDNYVSFVFDDNGLAGIRQRWIFDEMTSSSFLLDYDSDHNNSLNPQEIAQLKAEAFDNLKGYDYMTEIRIAGKDFPVQFITGFTASVSAGQLVYEFTIPCHSKAASTAKELRLLIFDPEYFIDFQLHADEIAVENAALFATTLKSAKNLEKSYYMGQFHPEETRLTFSRQP
jgi:ABC-type uncharacterized transport system substrate-binding protein